ncbi:Scr1 family TA system antitoxin-like transcriptional regulator [Kitasatospora sp. NPDC006697]|uniref:helix-turn-helix domain-containing protein n=1 Tax=Kitasatospora sp. NPDC006697 TaxID=3364020 RepID=UPI0036C72F37
MGEEIDPKSSLAAFYADRVRRARKKLGKSQIEIGAEVHTVGSRINQLERMTGGQPTLPLSQALDQALDLDELLEDIWHHMKREQFANYAKDYMRAEATATQILEYAGLYIPGLLQTRDYARAVLSVNLPGVRPNTEADVVARMERQQRLFHPNGLKWHGIIDQVTLIREVGGPTTMRAQLTRILRAAERPNITVQVLPLDAGVHNALNSSLSILTTPRNKQVAYTEEASTGRYFDDRAEVRGRTEVYDDLRSKALPPTMSLDLIRTILEDLPRDPRHGHCSRCRVE